MKKNERKAPADLIILMLLALGAAIFMLVMTAPFGLRITTDSVFYFQAARSFGLGDGFVTYGKQALAEPMIQYPPLYPMLLSAGPFAGMDIPGWARCVQAFLFGLNIFLISAFTLYLTRNVAVAAGAGVMGLICVQFVEISAAALSEPLFFVFMVTSFWSLTHYFEQGRSRFLYLAAVSACACYMTRHAGLPVALTGIVALALWSRGAPGKKIFDVGRYTVIALSVPALWVMRNILLSGQPTALDQGFMLSAMTDMGRSFDVLSEYIFPAMIHPLMRTIAFVLLSTGIILMLRAWRFKEAAVSQRMLTAGRIAAVFAIIYFTGTAILMVLSMGAVKVDTRILLPLPVVAIPFLAVFLNAVLKDRWRKAGLVLAALLLVTMALRTGQLTCRLYSQGAGYAGAAWVQRGLVRTVKTLSDKTIVYSNDPAAFYFYTGRPAILIPQRGAYDPHQFSPERVGADFSRRGAVAVIFEAGIFAPLPVWWQIVRRAPLTAVYRDGWGVLYMLANKTSGGAR
ncbi:MAG: hypothetical protein HQL17_00080 [Candidatus Omnitrophica bacterium]|nr:hypothetical protein [Candidatus Omnitrophota bacterium]